MNRRRAVRWVLRGCLALALVTTAGWVVVFDHPVAATGLTQLTIFGEFTHADRGTDRYTTNIRVTVPERGNVNRLTRSQYGDGTVVWWLDRQSGVDGPQRVTTVDGPDGTHTRLSYRNVSAIDPAVREDAIRVDGRHVYVEGWTAYDGLGIAIAVNETLNRTQFAPDGTTTRDGERLNRYDAVGTAGNDLPPALDSHPEGYLLADPATGALGRLSVTGRYRGNSIRIEIDVTRDNPAFPGWVDDVQANRSTSVRPST